MNEAEKKQKKLKRNKKRKEKEIRKKLKIKEVICSQSRPIFRLVSIQFEKKLIPYSKKYVRNHCPLNFHSKLQS